jgi:hypothetical protein
MGCGYSDAVHEEWAKRWRVYAALRLDKSDINLLMKIFKKMDLGACGWLYCR